MQRFRTDQNSQLATTPGECARLRAGLRDEKLSGVQRAETEIRPTVFLSLNIPETIDRADEGRRRSWLGRHVRGRNLDRVPALPRTF